MHTRDTMMFSARERAERELRQLTKNGAATSMTLHDVMRAQANRRKKKT